MLHSTGMLIFSVLEQRRWGQQKCWFLNVLCTWNKKSSAEFEIVWPMCLSERNTSGQLHGRQWVGSLRSQPGQQGSHLICKAQCVPWNTNKERRAGPLCITNVRHIPATARQIYSDKSTWPGSQITKLGWEVLSTGIPVTKLRQRVSYINMDPEWRGILQLFWKPNQRLCSHGVPG